jgi:pimeloyl-ACP methyl ester carboxylesterase
VPPLGDAGLSYLGVSYGTYLGTTYANLFPSKVRALLLDGAIEPVELATGRDGEGGMQPVFLRQGSHLGASQTLGAFLDLCAGAGPAACPFASGTDREATRARFQALLERLREQPIPVWTPQGAVQVTYALTVDVVLSCLHFEDLWSALSVVLQHLDQGDGSILLQLVGQLAPPSSTYDNTRDARLAVVTALNQPSTCALEAGIRYLVDLQLPAPGTVCRPDVGPFGPLAAAPALAAPPAAVTTPLLLMPPLR